MTETSQSKFFLTAQPFGGFQGSIQLPDGTRYAGTLWAAHSGDCDQLIRRIATTCSGSSRPAWCGG